MEINYGDAHFRRSDNGNAIYNPFVGNYIMDAFTTEIGGEVYLKTGERHRDGRRSPAAKSAARSSTPGQRGPAFIGKLGFDRQVNTDLRVRLTGSMYKTDKALSNTLYGGDRAGSRYYWVLENTAATESAQCDLGLDQSRLQEQGHGAAAQPVREVPRPGVFGVHRAGRRARPRPKPPSAPGSSTRSTRSTASCRTRSCSSARATTRRRATLAGITGDVGAKRVQVGGGWFITARPARQGRIRQPEVLRLSRPANIRNGGTFNGMMLEGVVAF